MKTFSRWLTGLVAAPHTAMNSDGDVNLGAIEKQAARLAEDGVTGAFICGSTGEGHSLTTQERRLVAERWRQVLNGTSIRLIVHAGHNSVEEGRQLAAHAGKIGADAVSVMAPCYFKPASVEDLIAFCSPIAAACPERPFYFYDIPALTGVNLSMLEFLRQAEGRIPNLAGIKFTSTNLMSLQECLEFEDGRFNILFGCDEMLLSALALGAVGAVGSTYNYSAPLYRDIISAYQAGNLTTAQALQIKSVKLIQVLIQYGVLPAGKALMSLVGVECGPVRPPVRNLTSEQKSRLFHQVEALGLFQTRSGSVAVPAQSAS